MTREITWIGAYRFVEEISDALAALGDGLDVSAVVTHRFGIEQAGEALACRRPGQQQGADPPVRRLSPDASGHGVSARRPDARRFDLRPGPACARTVFRRRSHGCEDPAISATYRGTRPGRPAVRAPKVGALSERRHAPSAVDLRAGRRRLARRTAMAGGLAAATAAFFGAPRHAAAGVLEILATVAGHGGGGGSAALLGFPADPAERRRPVVLPPGYRYQVLYPWGHPIVPSGPAFAEDASNSCGRPGPAGRGPPRRHVVLPAPGPPLRPALREPRGHGRAPAAHDRPGRLVAREDRQVDRRARRVGHRDRGDRDGGWHVVESRFARRMTMTTPVEITGPAAKHSLLRTGADPEGVRVLGTLNNCASGPTPWDTYLTCEETINKYFYFGEQPPPRRVGRGALRHRLGEPVPLAHHESRFDMRNEPNEYNRFGWVVEIDPFDPESTPKKRTALGRIEHENAVVVRGRRGEAVVYMGDDTQFDYFYKFVGAEPIGKAAGPGAAPRRGHPLRRQVRRGRLRPVAPRWCTAGRA